MCCFQQVCGRKGCGESSGTEFFVTCCKRGTVYRWRELVNFLSRRRASLFLSVEGREHGQEGEDRGESSIPQREAVQSRNGVILRLIRLTASEVR
mmetsp:Transcript_23595/g.46914  ORF Transcript_23595/g.46914 Transcript_23595/m.46914 type:complete len:95 (-) Transcript_23595:308-592(-)